jgi:poly-beta-hydroxybutyrate-responsive repressor
MPRLEDDPSHPRALLRPCVLLLLAERPGHGYDLIERLRPLGFDWGGPGPLYQTLRRLEDAGWVVSAWDASDAGPARRTYELTPEGRATLARWADSLDRLTTMLAEYRSRYESLALDAPDPGKHRPGAEPSPSSDSAAPRQGSGGRRVIPFGRRRGSSSDD